MKQRLIEETVLLAHVVKWFILATIVGVITGGATAAFVHTLQRGIVLLSSAALRADLQ